MNVSARGSIPSERLEDAFDPGHQAQTPAASESRTCEAAPRKAGVRIPVKMSPREWTIVLLLVASVIINYVDRSNLSLAVPLIQRQFALSLLQVGSLLSAFFWTYALLQLSGLAGWLADHLQVGWVLVAGYVLWSGATVTTGLVSSYAALFGTQLLLGVGESVAYPCYSRIFAELPQEHRGRANAMIDAGTKLGPALGALVGGLLLVHVGWRMLFVVLGTVGLVWLLPWITVMPRFERAEKPEDAAPLPSIAKLLQVKSAWGTFLGTFCGNYFFYFLLAWLPNYLVREAKMQIGPMSRLTSAIFFLIAGSTLVTGWISDRLIAGGIPPTKVRRTVVVSGMTVASSLLALALIHGHLGLSLGVLVVACVGYGAYASNHWAISQTLAGPAMAGRWSSVQNGVANLSGIVAPRVAGLIVQINGSSRLAFVIAGGVALAGAFIWALLVRRVELVQWDELAHRTH
jgi:MFS transporter, ACS family, D-galactonate transporter